MRALILATHLFSKGGVARHTATLAAALGNVIGHANVDVLVWRREDHAHETPHRVLGPVSARPGLVPKIRYVLASISTARQGYDLVIASHVALAPVAALIRVLRGTPYWVICHGFEVWSKVPWWQLHALRSAERALPVSVYTARKLHDVHGVAEGKLQLLRNAIPAGFASQLAEPPDVASDGATLLSVGSLNKALAYKGFRTVIAAMPRILAEVPEARYVIAGDGDDCEGLARLAEETGVADRVAFTGPVSDAELAAIYRSSALFVLPSRASGAMGEAAGEGFGRVYVEAALAGKPVVGSREAGAAEAVVDGETGILVDPTSVDDVAAAVIAVLCHRTMAQRMGAAGQAWARKNFTEDSMSQALSGLLAATGRTE
jgi:phosphatidyl-myo-inositol dimannoside synthase